MDGFLSGTVTLTERGQAFHELVRASHSHDEEVRRTIVTTCARVLTVHEIYHANSVIALFNFYNKFVDLNGVAELSAEGYEASGVRLSTQGYAPSSR